MLLQIIKLVEERIKYSLFLVAVNFPCGGGGKIFLTLSHTWIGHIEPNVGTGRKAEEKMST
jgi:hypothetical protein